MTVGTNSGMEVCSFVSMTNATTAPPKEGTGVIKTKLDIGDRVPEDQHICMLVSSFTWLAHGEHMVSTW